MLLFNKFITLLSFIFIFLVNSNTYGLYFSKELLEFEDYYNEICNDPENDSKNLRKISSEYDVIQYGAIIIGCNRKLGTELYTEELLDIYEQYAINDKTSKFMDFYNTLINKAQSFKSDFLKNGYNFFKLIKTDYDIEMHVKDLYFEDFCMRREEILLSILDVTLKDILKNNDKKYVTFIESASDLRNQLIKCLNPNGSSSISGSHKRKLL